jgi:hypothetical protein
MEIPPKSLLVFFDGFRNTNVDDVSSSRVEVQQDRKRLGQTDVEPFGVRYREGKVVHARIEYDGDRLTVSLNNRPVAVYSNIDLSTTSPGYIGFHGMGGYAYADVDILDFAFEPLHRHSTEVANKSAGQNLRDP